ncbi:MAG: hypothetical protein SF028_03440 [Candidatus Sumerlaeia bacterium]|nr:hypothetical protein [Candidatus Sumerlaeia bacterium]
MTPAPPRKGSVQLVSAADGKPIAGALVDVSSTSSVYDLDGSLGSRRPVRSHRKLCLSDSTGTVEIPEKFWQEADLRFFVCAIGFEPLSGSVEINSPGVPIGWSVGLTPPTKNPNFTLSAPGVPESLVVSGRTTRHNLGKNTIELAPISSAPPSTLRYFEGLQIAMRVLADVPSPASPAPIDPAPWKEEHDRAAAARMNLGDVPLMRAERGSLTLQVANVQTGEPVQRFWALVTTMDRMSGPRSEKTVAGPAAGIYVNDAPGQVTIPAHLNTTYYLVVSIIPEGNLSAKDWIAPAGMVGRKEAMVGLYSVEQALARDLADKRPLTIATNSVNARRGMLDRIRAALADDSPWASREGQEHLEAIEKAVRDHEAWFAGATGTATPARTAIPAARTSP